MYDDIDISSNVKEQFDISGRTALITGGAGFLGLQFAEAISEMGGIPLLFDNNMDHLQKNVKSLKDGGYKSCKSYVADITDEESCVQAIDQIINDFNQVDILINSAGLTKAGIDESNKNYFDTI